MVTVVIGQAKKAMKGSSDLFVPAALVDYVVFVPGVWLPAVPLPSLHL